MATTVRPKANGASDRASDRERASGRDQQYDLLTAAVLGVMIGAGAALLLRRGPSGRRPISPVARAAGDAALWAGKRGRRGAQWAAKRSGELWDRVPVDTMRREIGDTLDTAREAVADVVEHELRDFRKALRRQRKRLGI